MSRPDFSQIKCSVCPARSSRLCSSLDDVEIVDLDAIVHRLHLQAGEYLFQDGDPGDFVYNVSHGSVLMERFVADGRRQILSFIFPGDYLGFSFANTYRVSALALEETRLCRWRRADLEHLYEDYPKLEHKVLEIGAAVLGHALDLAFTLGRKTAREKVAFFLLHVKLRTEPKGFTSNFVDLPMSRGDIADFLGLTVETVSRIFSELNRNGILKNHGIHQVQILDVPALQEMSES